MINRFVGEYRFLSNFWPWRIESGGRVFRSVEHAYQVAKFLDAKFIEAIQATPTPGEAQRLGRLYQSSVDLTWESRRVAVMRELVRQGCFCAPEPCHGDVIANYLNAGGTP